MNSIMKLKYILILCFVFNSHSLKTNLRNVVNSEDKNIESSLLMNNLNPNPLMLNSNNNMIPAQNPILLSGGDLPPLNVFHNPIWVNPQSNDPLAKLQKLDYLNKQLDEELRKVNPQTKITIGDQLNNISLNKGLNNAMNNLPSDILPNNIQLQQLNQLLQQRQSGLNRFVQYDNRPKEINRRYNYQQGSYPLQQYNQLRQPVFNRFVQFDNRSKELNGNYNFLQGGYQQQQLNDMYQDRIPTFNKNIPFNNLIKNNKNLNLSPNGYQNDDNFPKINAIENRFKETKLDFTREKKNSPLCIRREGMLKIRDVDQKDKDVVVTYAVLTKDRLSYFVNAKDESSIQGSVDLAKIKESLKLINGFPTCFTIKTVDGVSDCSICAESEDSSREWINAITQNAVNCNTMSALKTLSKRGLLK